MRQPAPRRSTPLPCWTRRSAPIPRGPPLRRSPPAARAISSGPTQAQARRRSATTKRYRGLGKEETPPPPAPTLAAGASRPALQDGRLPRLERRRPHAFAPPRPRPPASRPRPLRHGLRQPIRPLAAWRFPPAREGHRDCLRIRQLAQKPHRVEPVPGPDWPPLPRRRKQLPDRANKGPRRSRSPAHVEVERLPPPPETLLGMYSISQEFQSNIWISRAPRPGPECGWHT